MEEAKITLVAKEGDKVVTDQRIKEFSVLIKNIVEDSGLQEEIPLVSVSKAILDKIIEYCQHHSYTLPLPIKKPIPTDQIKDAVTDVWDADFINSFDEDSLIDLTLASNYMDIKCVLDLCCGKIASMFKGKTIDELRAKYGITEEFTPEEEERLKKEYPWALEGDEERLLQAKST
jgi:hypothetical protein